MEQATLKQLALTEQQFLESKSDEERMWHAGNAEAMWKSIRAFYMAKLTVCSDKPAQEKK